MDPFIGEIRMFAGSFAPVGWALCNGQLLPIRQNTSLFALLNTSFGGDGKTTFGLPNLQGNAPVHAGQGVGLSSYWLGETGGTEGVTLNLNQIPAHTHGLNGDTQGGTTTEPAGNLFGRAASRTVLYYGPSGNAAQMAASTVTSSGGGNAHSNQQPYLVLSFIIATVGIFPSRS